MRFIFTLVALLTCTACARSGYFPAKPTSTIEVIDPAHGALGFVTDVPEGWTESYRTRTANERVIGYKSHVLASTMSIALITPRALLVDHLKNKASHMQRDGWTPGKFSMAGSDGRYFFATKPGLHRFLGARTYIPCGHEPSCTVTLDAEWRDGVDDDVHAAIRQAVTTFKFSE